MAPRGLRSILVAGIFMIAVQANWNDTSTGVNLDRLHRFPLTKIRAGFVRDGSNITFDGITASAHTNSREVRLRGVAKTGKRWEAHVCCLDEVWRGDLDGNGTQDFVFSNVGPFGNGRTAPPFSLTILLMDAQQMPVPFFTVIYKGENGDGIKHLVDLARNGQAELLISTYYERVSNARVGAFCSGYWTTQLYQIHDLELEEFRGTMGGFQFPFVHAWTDPRCPEEVERSTTKVESPILYEHGTSRVHEITTSIRAVEKDGWLRIDPVAGCKQVMPSAIVYDRADVREIGLPNPFSSYQDDLIGHIRRDRIPVTLRGVDRWMGHGDCSANVIWAAQ